MTLSRHSYHLKSLAPDDFERLVYWLVKRRGEFDAVHWYRGARASGRGRDVVAIKPTDTGREKWYIQCKRYGRVGYEILCRELDSLADLAAKMPNFAPDGVVFTVTRDVPLSVKERCATYAREVGLPEPQYWGPRELREMLDAQPETGEELLGVGGFPIDRVWSFFSQHTAVWISAIVLCVAVYFVIRTMLNLPSSQVSLEATPVAALIPTAAATATPLPSPSPTIASAPTSVPTPSPANTPQPTPPATSSPTNIPTFTSMPTSMPTSTPTPTSTPAIVPIRPALVGPAMGAVERAAVLRWEGELGPGQFFVVRLWYLGLERARQSEPLTTNCWHARLPAEWYGGWRWQVDVVQGTTVLVQSDEWDFWFDPFPRPRTPYPPINPCGE